MSFVRNNLAKIIAVITRKFYPRGTQRILRFFFNSKTLQIKDIITYDGDLRVNINTASYVEWELFFRGYYEKNVIDVMKKIFKKGFVAMDAGANIGSHTLIMAKLTGTSGKVFAFDPHPEICKRLTDNIQLNNLRNVKIFPLALSDKKGTMSLFSYSDEMSDQGTASLYELPNLQKSKFKVEVSTVDAIVEDENINRLDFIKIDTRGSDFLIIKGTSDSIKRFNPYIIFEYNRDNWERSDSRWEDAKIFFDRNNYSLYLIGEKSVRPLGKDIVLTTSHNILAVPNTKRSLISL